ncbi:hypothetical protein, partial [Klebsiella pneumoniae]|uniref:hypothetical protein n=1 Tax=Klebsiella pneumoniae TaxID=573 RepID=UPI003855F4A2
SKRPHKSLELMTPVDYILRESKNCNMWWTHTTQHSRCPLRRVCDQSTDRFWAILRILCH